MYKQDFVLEYTLEYLGTSVHTAVCTHTAVFLYCMYGNVTVYTAVLECTQQY
jgi:hypothetical protein